MKKRSFLGRILRAAIAGIGLALGLTFPAGQPDRRRGAEDYRAAGQHSPPTSGRSPMTRRRPTAGSTKTRRRRPHRRRGLQPRKLEGSRRRHLPRLSRDNSRRRFLRTAGGSDRRLESSTKRVRGAEGRNTRLGGRADRRDAVAARRGGCLCRDCQVPRCRTRRRVRHRRSRPGPLRPRVPAASERAFTTGPAKATAGYSSTTFAGPAP